MAHQKREANPTDEDLASKRPKAADAATETAYVEPGASQEANDEMRGRGSTSHNRNEAQADKSVSQETVLTGVEADAAEDKGCRHTMEDAWVVLPDTGAESPTNLRCAHFAIYDGHGGRLAAEYAQKHLHANVVAAGLPHGCESCKEGHC